MNTTTISLALLAALAGANAQAQSASNVAVYGLVDAGVEYTSGSAAADKGITRVSSGAMNTSRWGVKGSEDLGGGLKAVFNLEGGIFLDSGAQDGVLFKRQANLGLEGGFGRVIVGRSFTTTYDFMLAFDPMGYSADYSWVTSGNNSGASKYGMPTAFDNLIKYQGQFGAVKLGATVGLGEQASGGADSAKYAAGAAYSSGPLSVAATYDQVNDNAIASGGRDHTSTLHLAAAYDAGAWKLQAGVREFKTAYALAGKAERRANTYWGGVNWLCRPAVTLTGAVYYQDVRNLAAGADADPVMYVVRVKYALSKRTDLYSALAYTKAGNGKPTSLSRDEAGLTSHQSGLVAGIQHRF